MRCRPVFKGRILCQICFASTTSKYLSRDHFEKITNFENFKDFAKRWKNYDHEYNKVFDLIDSSNSNEKYAHKSCKGKFLKESFMTAQPKIGLEPSESETCNLHPEKQNINQADQRKSDRKSLSYTSSSFERKCIICNENKYHKGRLLPLCNLSLKEHHSENYKAEKTLIEFAHIHVDNSNEKYIDGTKRVLLTTISKSLFAADVSYHKPCFDSFRAPHWKNKKCNDENKPAGNRIDDLTLLYDLVEHHIVSKHEIYTMSQLCNYYSKIVNKYIRSIDLKKKLQEKFKNRLKFVKPSYYTNWNSSEFVMSSCDDLIGECVNATNLGEGIEMSVMIKNLSQSITEEI